MSTTASSPYLSVVATTRNDDHGGDLRKRMQIFVDGLAAQANRHRTPVELILVEWNPPRDRPPLREALRWPAGSEDFRVRIVTVAPAVHSRFDPGGALPLFQMLAKNAGIRRARGRFVLATNVDLLFPDELFRALRDGLLEGVLYRNDRLDVSREIPEGAPWEQLMEFCRANVLRQHRANGTYVSVGDGWVNTNPTLLGLCLEYLQNWGAEVLFVAYERIARRAFRTVVHGRDEADRGPQTPGRGLHRLHGSALGMAALVTGGALLGPVVLLGFLVRRGPRALLRGIGRRVRALRRAYSTRRDLARLHTNGCGDFTLLDRETWFRLRGYPEWPLFSWHLDSVLLLQADANRVPFRILPPEQCTYHVDHGGGWTPEDQGRLFSRLAERGIRVLTDEELLRLRDEMGDRRRRSEPVVYNGEDWGLASEDLPEASPLERPAHRT